MKEIEQYIITANGLNHHYVHYVTAGSGQPLVLLHGFPQTWLQWRPLIELLSEMAWAFARPRGHSPTGWLACVVRC